MKLLLAAVNAKYIHTNLALRYLKKCSESICETRLNEYSINDNILSVERDIILSKPDILAFSCYIWNISYILTLAGNIKKALPDTKIILGGPEVSYDAVSLMFMNPFIDYIIKGEGEITFPETIKAIVNNKPVPGKGVTYRCKDGLMDSEHGDLPDFSDIPFPYTKEDLSLTSNRIIYYESSRGCPYSCKYCLSGEKGRVRYKSVEEVKKDLKFFSDNGVRLVKFVDRTFNADKKRAFEIWQYIASLNTKTRFHMEITGELLNDETIELLKEVNSDNLQFEIGVQSTNTDTLWAISRKCNLDKLFNNIRLLLDNTDIHIHLDLIAGLPHENFESFKTSFNRVVSLRPHVLQLGFLKLLKGSVMREEANKHEITYRDNAPYEIISNKYINCDEMIFLKDIDFVFDKYYNSGSFSKTIDYLFKKFDDRFEIFSHIVNYYRETSLINTSISKNKLYDILYKCFSYLGMDFEEALRYDCIYSLQCGKLPEWCNTDNDFTMSQEVYDFLKNDEIKKSVIPHMVQIPAKSVIKHVRFEKFSYGVLMFDYKDNKVYNVSKYFDK